MTAPCGGPRYDAEWTDVLEAEAMQRIEHAVKLWARCARLAEFFYGVRAAR